MGFAAQHAALFAVCVTLLISFAMPDNPFVECCALKLMDSNMQVAIETSRPLTTGTFQAITARVCTTDPLYVQIWTRVNNNQYQLKWQTMFTPTYNQTTQAASIFPFDSSNPVSITSDDRLGLYNPSMSNLKFAVPYDFDSSAYSMHLSNSTYPDKSVFVPGSGFQILVNDLSWPRSFGTYIKFCTTSSQCPTLPTDQSPPTTPSYSNYITIPATCCSSKVSCDSSGQIGNQINNQNKQVQDLQNQLQILQQKLNGLLNSQLQTGSCPTGFVPGVYGVGFCYQIVYTQAQMGPAAILCNDNQGSRLIDIISEAEEKFIKNLIMNNSISLGQTGVIQFWTSGLYDANYKNWNWYNEALSQNQPFGNYRNWLNQQEPAANSFNDRCCSLTVDISQGLDYWQKATCTDSNFYICKKAKTCY